MKKYTFESWLNNEIDENTLYSLGHGLDPWKYLIDEVDFRKIRAKQKETFVISVDISFKSRVRLFESEIKRSPNPKEMYSNQLTDVQSILDEDQEITKKVVRGYKDYSKITGQQYSEVQKGLEIFNINEINRLEKILNDCQYIWWILKYRDYLKSRTETNKQDIPIIELSYDDWFECRRAPYNGWQAGENLFTVNGINRVEYLPFDQYKLIRKEQEKTYNEEVNRMFKVFIDIFEEKLKNTTDYEKSFLLNIEIETIEKVLKPDPKKLYKNAIPFIPTRFMDFKEKYKNMVATGNREYHKIKSHKCFDYSMEIEIDAYAKYLNWLENINLEKQNDIPPPQTENQDIELEPELRESFKFLLGNGRKALPMLEQDQFEILVDRFKSYYNNEQLPDNIEPIHSINVTKKYFLLAVKNFHRSYTKKKYGNPQFIPQSLADLINKCITQDTWKADVTIEAIQRASDQ